jgi:hypothetical protein
MGSEEVVDWIVTNVVGRTGVFDIIGMFDVVGRVAVGVVGTKSLW